MNNPSRVAFTLFGRDVYWYGVLMALGILIAVWLTLKEGKRKRLTEDDILDMCLVIIPSGVVGARLYYVIFEWASYASNPIRALYIWEGGLAIYGAVIGGLLGMFIYSRVRKIRFLKLADCIAPGLVLAQAIGRWGNFFNREAFGEYTDRLFAMRLPVDAVRSGDITEKMREHMERINGVSYIQVHPTFLYESLWCAVLLIILVLYRKHKKYEGELFLLYLFGYGLGRVWIEGLRTDQLLLPEIGLPVSQLLAGALVIGTGIAMLYLGRHHKNSPMHRSVTKYEPMPEKIKGKKPPKWNERLFKNMK